jgi:hypothetical protein
MLNALGEFPSITTTDRVSIQAPRLYLFLSETNTQVIEDVPDAIDLKSILVSPTANSILDQSLATSIGYALGSWLRYFHTWASAPAQAELRREIGKNELMRKLKSKITYDRFIQVLEDFPDILEGYRKTLEDVKDLAAREFKKNMGDEVEDNCGIIHGDFWTGK